MANIYEAEGREYIPSDEEKLDKPPPVVNRKKRTRRLTTLDSDDDDDRSNLQRLLRIQMGLTWSGHTYSFIDFVNILSEGGSIDIVTDVS